MDSVSSTKAASAAHQGEAEAAQDTKNKSTKGDVEGLSDARPQTPPADPTLVQGETKKMAELTIKEQEVEQPATSADDKSAPADDKEATLSTGEQSAPKSEDSEKTEASAATGQPDKTDVGGSTVQEVQPSSVASEAQDGGSVADSESSAKEGVPKKDVGAEGEAFGEA